MFDIKLPQIPKQKQSSHHEASVRQSAKSISYAPFGSTVSKSPQAKHKSKTIEMPGPGQYDIARPILKPIVETIKKNNNNIIVKINEIGSSSFKGPIDRFQEDANSYPGPGKYDINRVSLELDKRNKKRKYNSFHNYKQKFTEVFDHKKQESIPPQRILDDEVTRMHDHNNAANTKVESVSRAPIWSKFTEERFKSGTNNIPTPGPGSYQIPDDIRNQQIPSHVFISESVRSFFDNICYETNQDELAMMREKEHFKSKLPGPGTYNLQSLKNTKKNQFQFFSSTQKRPGLVAKETVDLSVPDKQRGFKLEEVRESLKLIEYSKKKHLNAIREEDNDDYKFEHLLSIRNQKIKNAELS